MGTRLGVGLIRAAVARSILLPRMEGSPWLRLMDVSARARLVMAASMYGLAWLIPGATTHQRLVFVVLVSAVYLPFGAMLVAVRRRSNRPAVRIASVFGNLLVIFLFALELPQTRVVSLLAYLLIAAFGASLAGGGIGIGFGLAGLALTILAQAINPALPRVDPFTLGMYCVVLGSLSILLHATTKAHRTANARLTELHASLRTVSSALELGPMLDAISEAAKRTLGARYAVVVLPDHEIASIGVPRVDYQPDVVKRWGAIDRSPSSVAIETGREVIAYVDDGTWPEFAPIATQVGISTVLAEPITVQGHTLAALSVAFSDKHVPTVEELDLTRSLAGQATVAYERATAYEKARTAAQRLQELDQMKSEFVSSVSHELKTPLTSISGFAELLLHHWESIDIPTRRELLVRIGANTKQLAALMDQLLDYGKLNSGWTEIRPARLNLFETVRRIAATMSPATPGRRVEIEIPADLEVEADPFGVERILVNLLSNAAKYSPPGLPILIEARPDGVFVTISVTDRGPGLRSDESSRIFDLFYRGERRFTEPGAGIGLAVARRYVELHGGRIWVSESEGAGATFCFTLPRTKVRRSAAPVMQPARSA